MNNAHLVANRFEIQDVLGRGGMGEVYRARDTQTGETVAVKALNLEILQRDPCLLERFVREGEALRQLNHPNIVHMIAAVEEDGRHYLVMEFMEGGSLQDVLASRGYLPANEVVKIALEVADALTRAHHLGIIHRDLKPANVLLAKDGTPRLGDFGIAHVQNSSHLTQTGVLIGTVDYLSPEVCQGESPNELSDIWALGVMLFEMLSGRLPFEGKSMTAKITAILHQPLPDLSQLAPGTPEALVDLIYRMLEKDPRQRIPSIRLVGAELDAIQKGREKTTQPVSSYGMPAFLEKGEDVELSIFVTRESELAQLDHLLNRSMESRGQVAFITGDPGQGKTALTQEFARQACQRYPDLVIASGNCNAYTGIGDPYLPFREILGLLCGDIESRWEARAISREQAKRLWQCIPLTVQALVQSGRDLVDIFVSGDTLVKRVAIFSPWSGRGEWFPKLEQLVQRKAAIPSNPNFQQSALFEQYTRLLCALAHQRPLLLILDDLQWADSGSTNLLFHLGKGIEGSRIMILGTYRPTEVALGRGGERHPLESIVNEFKRQFGNIQIELGKLGKSDGRRFVDAIIDSEHNRLGENFRATLFRLSEGQPLGTIELLRDMQEQGGLVQDTDGYWIESSNLSWDTLPARLEGMIAERIDRLDDAERQILKVASVEGEVFTAEIIAQVLGADINETVRLLSNELNKRHHLVSAQNIREANGQHLSLYRFRHILFQRYLYNTLDTVERPRLHQIIGITLQNLYGDGNEEIAGQLARHFREAGTNLKAADYLNQAGDRARELVAHQEAIEHYQEAMTSYEQALGNKWEPLQKAILERKIGESLFQKGEYQQALDHLLLALIQLGKPLPTSRWKIRFATLIEIMRQIGHRLLPGILPKQTKVPINPVMEEAVRLYESVGWIEGYINPERFLFTGLRLLNDSERSGYFEGIGKGSMGLGIALDSIAFFGLANGYHRKALAIADQNQNPSVLRLALTGLAIHYHMRDDLEAAIKYEMQSADLCRKIDDLHNWGFATMMLIASLHNQGNSKQALFHSQELFRSGQEGADLQLQCWGFQYQGVAHMRLGHFSQAIAYLQEAIKLANAIPSHANRISAGSELASCYLRQGQLEIALSTLEICHKIFLEHGAIWGNETALVNGLVEVYLNKAEQVGAKDESGWLNKAKSACRSALKLAQMTRPALPEALRLRGNYEWLRGSPSAAQKWWRHSLVLAEEKGQRYDLGRVHLEMGKRLGNRDHLERAIAIFAEIGAEWDLACAREALKETA